MRLKVGLVSRCLNAAHIRGMGRYVFELIRQSKSRENIEWVLFANNSKEQMTVPEGVNAKADVFEFKGDRFWLWEQIGLPLRAIKRNVDIIHCTETTLPLWQPKPTVVTVHDTLMWDEPIDDNLTKFFYNKLLPAAMNKCAAIITISESSKTDILKKWPQHEIKLTVIPHGIADEYFIEDRPGLPESIKSQIGETPYLVYLGGPIERKRFSWALNVFSQCNHRPLKLIACGFGDEARMIAKANLPANLQDDVYFAEFLSEHELLALYKNAQAVLYPTLYEGFGFPAIEAQAAGVPVLFSALGSLAELIGPLAKVLPPFDLDAWLNALDEALTLKGNNKELSQAAKLWAKRFSWSESAAKHIDVYCSVLDRSI